MFTLATIAIFLLTLLCIGLNALGWIRIRGLYQLALSPGRAPVVAADRKIEGVAQLTWLIRLEAIYFTLLLVYVLAYPGVLAIPPILLVVVYHGLGLGANEVTSTTQRLYAKLKAGNALSSEVRRRITLAVRIIGFLDTVEIIILVYVALTSFQHSRAWALRFY